MRTHHEVPFRRARAGFTMIETMISAVVVSFIVCAAVGASHAAMRTTSSVVSVESSNGRSRSALDRVRAMLLSASAGSVKGIPLAGGQVEEAMLDNVDYADMSFRTVTGYEKGGPVYVPAANQPAFRLYREVDNFGKGSLVLDTGRVATTLVDGVRSATFRKTGRMIEIVFVSDTPDASGSARNELQLVLLVP